MTRRPRAAEDPSLPDELSRTVASLRDSLHRLVAALPEPPARPQELSRAIGIDKMLAWKIFRLAEGGPGHAGRLPGEAGMERALDAFATRLGQDKVAAARAAAGRLRALSRRHAGSRASLLTMLDATAGDDRVRRVRREAFVANAAALGVRAACQVSLRVLFPSAADSSRLDAAGVSGLVGLHRLHPSVPWVVARSAVTGPGVTSGPVPLDPSCRGRLPLLGEFCPDSPVGVEVVEAADGSAEARLLPGRVGLSAACTVFTGERISAAVPASAGGSTTHGHVATQVATPVEALLQVVAVAKDANLGEPLSAVYVQTGGTRWSPAAGAPFATAEAVRVTPRTQDAALAAWPDARRLLEHVMSLLGGDGDRFEVYATSVPHPLLASAVVTSFPLPQG